MSSLKVSPEEMRRLLNIEQPNPRTQPAPTVEHRQLLFTSAHTLLGRALPRLWRFAQTQPEARDPRALHRKLRELIVWAFEKDGYRVHPNHPMPYRHDTEHIEGRLELLIAREGSTGLAIETDWFGDRTSLLKLEAAHVAGHAAMWIVGKPQASDTLGELRRLANRTLKQASGRWLAIYHLEHGWVRTARTF